MCADLLLDPGFSVRTLPGTGPGGHLATITSSLVFESAHDALRHLFILVALTDPAREAVTLEALPVRAHVPGAPCPDGPIGYRLASRGSAPTDAVAEQVAALCAAATQRGMTGAAALEALT